MKIAWNLTFISTAMKPNHIGRYRVKVPLNLCAKIPFNRTHVRYVRFRQWCEPNHKPSTIFSIVSAVSPLFRCLNPHHVSFWGMTPNWNISSSPAAGCFCRWGQSRCPPSQCVDVFEAPPMNQEHCGPPSVMKHGWKSRNVGIAMPFAPSPIHHHVYGWYRPSKMDGLWHCYTHIINEAFDEKKYRPATCMVDFSACQFFEYQSCWEIPREWETQ